MEVEERIKELSEPPVKEGELGPPAPELGPELGPVLEPGWVELSRSLTRGGASMNPSLMQIHADLKSPRTASFINF